MSADAQVRNSVAVADPDSPQHFIKPNADGSINVVAAGSGEAVTIANGADVTQGAIADAAATAGSTGTISAKLRLMTTQLAALASTLTVQVAGYLFQNITTSTTTTVKSGAGVLNGVTVNSKGTVASTVTIYDNTAGSGTKIGTIDSLTLSGQFVFGVAFATGLTLVTTGTAAPDITVSYR